MNCCSRLLFTAQRCLQVAFYFSWKKNWCTVRGEFTKTGEAVHSNQLAFSIILQSLTDQTEVRSWLGNVHSFTRFCRLQSWGSLTWKLSLMPYAHTYCLLFCFNAELCAGNQYWWINSHWLAVWTRLQSWVWQVCRNGCTYPNDCSSRAMCTCQTQLYRCMQLTARTEKNKPRALHAVLGQEPEWMSPY